MEQLRKKKTFETITKSIGYHYEYQAYTDNLNYGRMLIARSRNKAYCDYMARSEGKGAYVIEKHRVYNYK